MLQGMDTSGKGGVIRHAIGMVDPQGGEDQGFQGPDRGGAGPPLPVAHSARATAAGLIGIFDRSHYEDVLVVRVNNLVEESVWSQRYDEINAWEDELVEPGHGVDQVLPQHLLCRAEKRP